MEIETKIKVILNDEEKEALRVLSSIGCKGIACTECPFMLSHCDSCFIVLARDITHKQGLNYTID